MSWLFSLGNIPYSLNKAKKPGTGILFKGSRTDFASGQPHFGKGHISPALLPKMKWIFVSFFLSKLEHKQEFYKDENDV